MQSENVPIKSLKKYSKNQQIRKISDEQYAKLRDNLLKHGWLSPLIVDRKTKEIIGGNQRYRAALDLIDMDHVEFKQVPVYWIDVDDDDKSKALVSMLLNNHYGEYDLDGLTSVVKDLDIDMIELGDICFPDIDLGDLSILIDADNQPGKEKPDTFPDVKEFDLDHKCPKCGFEYNDE